MTQPLVIERPEGTITVSAAALAQLVQAAAERVDGVRVRRRRRGLDVDLNDGGGRVHLALAVRRGEVLPVLARAVQEEVAAAVARACELELEAVDVSVEEVDG